MTALSWLYVIIFFSSLCTTAVSTAFILRPFSKFAKQPIYTDGPNWHIKKQGTPTIGGLSFIITGVISVLIIIPLGYNAHFSKQFISILLTVGFAILNGAVGLTDDLIKLLRRNNAGLTPMQKILFQMVIAIAFLYLRYKLFGDETSVEFFKFNIELGWLYYPFCLFIILGIINCANLTDGIDGLASSVSFGIGIGLFFICYTFSSEASITASLIAGIGLGFIIFNINPAKIFMGDTGSLFLGALFVGAVFQTKIPLLSIPLGIIYVIEGISVILQVLFYKKTGRRIFKMAPIHHHLEKCGMDECKICLIAILITLVSSFAIGAIGI